MKLKISMVLLAVALATGWASAAVSVFEFDGDFSSTGPAQMSFFQGNSFGSFGTDIVNGAPSGVFNFPALTQSQGLMVTHNAPPNGGGNCANQYTLGFDIKWVNASGYAAFFQTNQNNSNDSDLFRRGDGGIGTVGGYHGTMLSDTWYRVMFSFDLAGEIGPARTLYKYIDGSLVGSQVLPAGIDGRWALDPYFLLFTDEDGETNAGSISRFWFEDRAITGAEAAMYGGANIPEPATLALLAFGVLPMLKRRR